MEAEVERVADAPISGKSIIIRPFMGWIVDQPLRSLRSSGQIMYLVSQGLIDWALMSVRMLHEAKSLTRCPISSRSTSAALWARRRAPTIRWADEMGQTATALPLLSGSGYQVSAITESRESFFSTRKWRPAASEKSLFTVTTINCRSSKSLNRALSR